MAPPPKHVITRTLIKRYFKKFIPRGFDNTKRGIKDLKDCFKMHGMNSDKCNGILEKLEAAYMKQSKVRSQYKKLDIQAQVLESLKKPVYPFQRKGRYRDIPVRQKTIYDGIF